MNYLIFDIETIAIPIPLEVLEQVEKENEVDENAIYKKLQAKYKRQETIDKHYESDLQKAKEAQTTAVEKYQRDLAFNPFYSEIVAIGYCELVDGEEMYSCNAHSKEADLIYKFGQSEIEGWKYVTYNGNRFDWFHIRNKLNKYKLGLKSKLSFKNHIDLTQAGIARYGKPISLDKVCKENYISQIEAEKKFPVEGFTMPNGSNVQEMYDLDQLDRENGLINVKPNRVANYCLQDVWKTCQLLKAYLRTEHL